MKIRILVTALVLCSSGASAQNGNLTLVAGFPAGGPSSIVARHLADTFYKYLGEVTIVENRPGAGGRIAADYVARQPADGKTLLVMSSASALKVAPGTGLVPVSRVMSFDFVFAIGSALKAVTLSEYIEEARSKEKLRTFTSPGAGTIPHLVVAEIAQENSVPLLHVPYQGSAAATQSVIGGHVAAAIFGMSDAQPALDYGVRPLFVASSDRARKLPAVPALRELGYDIDASGWHALFVHSGTPPERVRKLNAAVAVAARSLPPTLIEMGFSGAASTPEEMDALHRRDYERWMPVAQRLGIQP